MNYLLNLRQLNILKHMINNENIIIRGDVLSTILFTNLKTLKTDVDLINKVLEFNCGCKIISTPGIGYELVIENKRDYNRFKQVFESKISNFTLTPINLPSQRSISIIQMLLNTNDYIKLSVFAEKLFLSRSTLSKEVKIVRDISQSYHLKIESTPYHGLKLNGREIHKRLMLIDFLTYDEDNTTIENSRLYMDMLDFYDLKQILENELKYLNLSLSKSSLEKIIKLFNVSISRHKNGFKIKEDDYSKKTIINKLAITFVQNVFKNINLSMSISEINVLSLFVSSRLEMHSQNDSETRGFIKYYNLAQEMLNWIYETINYYFADNEQLILDLTRYFQSMFLRLEYGFEKKNIMTDYAKQNHKSYETALLMMQFLYSKFGLFINEDEIAYLSYITERYYTEPDKPLNIQVVMHNGELINNYVIDQIKNSFNNINRINGELFYNLSNEDEATFDCIITDIPRNEFDSLRTVINISNPELNEDDLSALKKVFENNDQNLLDFIYGLTDYFEISHKNQSLEVLLDNIIENITVYQSLPDDFKDMLLKRENISSYINSNGVMILSTMYMSSILPLIYLIKLKNPYIHNYQSVSLIIIISNGIGERYPYSTLNYTKTIFSNSNLVYEVLINDNIADIIPIFKKYTNEL